MYDSGVTEKMAGNFDFNHMGGLEDLVKSLLTFAPEESADMINKKTQVRFRVRRKGAVAVETAFMLIFVFLPIVLGIVEFGRAVMVRQVISNAAREGCRQGIIPGATIATVSNSCNGYLSKGGISSGNLVVHCRDGAGTVVADLDDINSHEAMQVFVSVPYNDVSWGVLNFLGGSTVQFTAEMRRE